jgi:uncharacterized membrane protein
METMQSARSEHQPELARSRPRLQQRTSLPARRGRLSTSSATHTQRRPDTVDRLARGLGWFSVVLGTMELVAPRTLDRAIGAGHHPDVTRWFGLRELAAGIGLLTRADPTPWLWSRVAGDAMDLAALGAAMVAADTDERVRLSAAAFAVAGVTAVDVYAARAASAQRPRSAPGVVRRDGSVRVEHTMAVNRPPEECYRLWRSLETLPRFMEHLDSVQVQDERRSHWIAKGPAGTRVEWDAEITRDEPGSLISWRSLDDSEVRNAGAVRFVPAAAGRGTLVSVSMQYQPPGGALGKTVAKLLGDDPDMTVREDLRRFKRLLEAGELPTIEGQPHGPRPAWYRAFGGQDR